MQVFLASAFEDIHRAQFDPWLFNLLFDFILDFFKVFSIEQTCKLTNIQDAVDIFKEDFVLDVLIREGKDCFLVVDTQSLEQIAKVFLPLGYAVVLMNFDGELRTVVNVNCKFGDGLAPVTAKAD